MGEGCEGLGGVGRRDRPAGSLSTGPLCEKSCHTAQGQADTSAARSGTGLELVEHTRQSGAPGVVRDSVPWSPPGYGLGQASLTLASGVPPSTMPGEFISIHRGRCRYSSKER